MSFLRNCTPLPYFSNPYLTFDGEKLGDEFGYVNYNVKWIRQNRFLLQSVGTEDQKCEFTEGSILVVLIDKNIPKTETQVQDKPQLNNFSFVSLL